MSKKQLFTLEFPVRCSPSILYEFLSTPAGLQEWFADKVDERDNVFIAPDLDISDLLNQGKSDEEIEIEIFKIDDDKPKNKKFKQSDFKKGFIEGLRNDYENLFALNERWQAVEDNNDPKWNVFINLLKIESRPVKEGDQFNFWFLMEFDGYFLDDSVQSIMAKHTSEIKWLGSYVKTV